MDWILILLCEATCHIGIIFWVSWKLYCNRSMFCLSSFTLVSGSTFLRPYDGPWQHGTELTPCLLLKSTGLDCASEQLVWIFSELHVSPAYISPCHLRVFKMSFSILSEVHRMICEGQFCWNSIRKQPNLFLACSYWLQRVNPRVNCSQYCTSVFFFGKHLAHTGISWHTWIMHVWRLDFWGE